MTNHMTLIRTPYHELSEGNSPLVPEWAQHRSVYRSAGRTLYLVETDSLDSASDDLLTLAERGWDVQIDRAAGNPGASISLSRRAA